MDWLDLLMLAIGFLNLHRIDCRNLEPRPNCISGESLAGEKVAKDWKAP